jgi:hypothetical protein
MNTVCLARQQGAKAPSQTTRPAILEKLPHMRKEIGDYLINQGCSEQNASASARHQQQSYFAALLRR